MAGGDVARARARPRSRCTSRGPVTPTSSACRSTASTTPATCSSARSARETAARVAAGALAKALLAELGTAVISHVVQHGRRPRAAPTRRARRPPTSRAVDDSPVRCFDPDAEAAMIAEIEAAAKAGDSLGGVVEVLGYGVPPGLGSHVHWDRRIDGLLAQALMSIQAMKARRDRRGLRRSPAVRGSEAHDEILWDADAGEYTRGSTRAGGIEGGMTTGDLLVARVAMKPLATLNRPVLQAPSTPRPRRRRSRSRSAPT